MLKAAALIPAAGVNRRFSESENKLLINIAGKTILEHTISAFDTHPQISEIVIITNPALKEELSLFIAGLGFAKPIKITNGGNTRQESVKLGLEYVTEDIVLIHDAARPMITHEIINNCLNALSNYKSCVVCVPVIDTIKEVDSEMFSKYTPDRSKLYATQTPQGFHTDYIKELHKKAKEADFTSTDDASLAEWQKEPVKIVLGDYNNIKITTKADIDILESKLGRKRMIRTGIGIDTHKLSETENARPLVIGGVNIPYPYGLEGHSDADVLIHAIIDALLGASSLGDIGQHFPPSDNKYKNIDSLILLKEVYRLITEKGCSIINIDSVIIAQKPKLAKYLNNMKTNVAKVLNIDLDCIEIKATTTEKLGFEGRCEGISAHATCLITKIY